MECTFCHKTFSGRPTLLTHQRTVKSCLLIQEQQGHVTKKKKYECTHCNKEFTAKESLRYHDQICKSKVQPEDFNELKDTIVKLQQEVTDLKSRPTTTNNTTIHHTTNNISIINYMTEERVLRIFKDHFNRHDLPEKNLADFTYKWFLKGNDKPVYLCTDPNRKRFVFMDQHGNEVVDKNCSTLIALLYQAQPYIKDLIQDEIVDQSQDEINLLRTQYKAFLNLETDGNDYKLELCRRLPSIPPSIITTPPKDDINWNINVVEEEPKQMESVDDDPLGFFS